MVVLGWSGCVASVQLRHYFPSWRQLLWSKRKWATIQKDARPCLVSVVAPRTFRVGVSESLSSFDIFLHMAFGWEICHCRQRCCPSKKVDIREPIVTFQQTFDIEIFEPTNKVYTLTCKAGHLRYFWIFFNSKYDIFTFFIKLIWLGVEWRRIEIGYRIIVVKKGTFYL